MNDANPAVLAKGRWTRQGDEISIIATPAFPLPNLKRRSVYYIYDDGRLYHITRMTEEPQVKLVLELGNSFVPKESPRMLADWPEKWVYCQLDHFGLMQLKPGLLHPLPNAAVN